jgi:SAM-dependent methyltransferase
VNQAPSSQLNRPQSRLQGLDWHEAIKVTGPIFRFAKKLALATGYNRTHWLRYVMDRECLRILDEIESWRLATMEISGLENIYSPLALSLSHNPSESGSGRGRFKSYESTSYPEFDICSQRLDKTFDLIIANQVFEHLLWPYRAGKNVYSMLNPNGYFLITTPFLLKVHDNPVDCSRWTELGMKYFLAECGFPLESIRTASWGNRACVSGNFMVYAQMGWGRPLHNERDFPCMVWALARKQAAGAIPV